MSYTVPDSASRSDPTLLAVLKCHLPQPISDIARNARTGALLRGLSNVMADPTIGDFESREGT